MTSGHDQSTVSLTYTLQEFSAHCFRHNPRRLVTGMCFTESVAMVITFTCDPNVVTKV